MAGVSAPAGIAVEQALTQQRVALATLKKSADADKAFANVIDQQLRSQPNSSGRGSIFNALV